MENNSFAYMVKVLKTYEGYSFIVENKNYWRFKRLWDDYKSAGNHFGSPLRNK